MTKKPKMEDVIKYCIEYDNYYILSTMTDADLKNIGDLIARNNICNLFLFDIAKFRPKNNLYLLESIKSSNIEYFNLVKQENKIKKDPILFTYHNSGDNKDKTVYTLKEAIKYGSLEIIESMYTKKSPIFSFDDGCKKIFSKVNTPFNYACSKNYPDIVQFFLDNFSEKELSMPCDITGTSGFMKACQKGYIDIVNVLIHSDKVDVKKAEKLDYGESPFVKACNEQNCELIDLLHGLGFDPNKLDKLNGLTPLIKAIKKRADNVVRLLLSYPDVDYNHKDNYSVSPLMYSCQYGLKEFVKLLLQKPNININETDNGNQTTLIKAVLTGQVEIVQILLESKGIDINFQDSHGQSPLFYACLTGNLDILTILLADGRTDANIKNSQGWIPLMIFSQYGRPDVVRILCLSNKDINVNDKDVNGATALEIACIYHQNDVIKELIQFPKIDLNVISVDFLDKPEKSKIKSRF